MRHAVSVQRILVLAMSPFACYSPHMLLVLDEAGNICLDEATTTSMA